MTDKREKVNNSGMGYTTESLYINRRINNIFSEICCNGSLKEILNTFTKPDLDIIGQTLEVVGAVNLKKAELIRVLDETIKASICLIIKKLSDSEYKLLAAIIQNGGVVKFQEEFFDEIVNLRKYGVVVTGKTEPYGKYVLVPQELRYELDFCL